MGPKKCAVSVLCYRHRVRIVISWLSATVGATEKCYSMQMKHITGRSDVDRRRKIGEILRFGIVGVLATLIQYGVYRGLLLFIPDGVSVARAQFLSSLCMTAGYAISFIFNFFASTRFTFRVEANARRGAGFAFSHAVNYLLQMATLNFFLWIGLSKAMAPVPMFCICVPVNFVLVRFFLKR